jgi:hypothetical protein
MKCRHCGSELKLSLVDLGSAPPSNAYLTAEALAAPERCYPLRVLVCSCCWLVQTEDYVGAEELFSADYAYFSSYSSTWLRHVEEYVSAIMPRFGLKEIPPPSTGGGVGEGDRASGTCHRHPHQSPPPSTGRGKIIVRMCDSGYQMEVQYEVQYNGLVKGRHSREACPWRRTHGGLGTMCPQSVAQQDSSAAVTPLIRPRMAWRVVEARPIDGFRWHHRPHQCS